ncbi:hypothetical protein STANM309S_02583 [Streptomyces tanashiensis]
MKGDVLADFASAGFALREVTSFAQPVTASLDEYRARLLTRPQSKFTHLIGCEPPCRGLALVEAAVRDGPRPSRGRWSNAMTWRCSCVCDGAVGVVAEDTDLHTSEIQGAEGEGEGRENRHDSVHERS